MIGSYFGRGSLARRITTRAVPVLGAVLVSGHLARSYPRDQVLVFPVGSVFPNATRFGASWKRADESESRGGVAMTFSASPPLRIRQHTALPDGDYVVSVEISEGKPTENSQIRETSTAHEGVQTNIERRVTLAGGETLVVLAAGGF